MSFAFVFPGQGSQSVGMLSDFNEAVVSATFLESSDALGYDMAHLIAEGPEDKINQTEFTQPALLTCSVALWRLWSEKSEAVPQFFAGHSLGEYSALVCAGVIGFPEAVKLVALRGRAMQEAVGEGEGAMAAVIGLDDEQVAALCTEVRGDQVLSPANYNSIGQVVVAGHAGAVERLIEAAKEAGARMAVSIPVSAPSHCALMKPAADRLAEALDALTFASPTIPVVNNVDVCVYEGEGDIKNALVRQLYSPVRWVETIQWFAGKGITAMAECGPGKVLAGLNKRIIKTLSTAAMDADEKFKQAVADLK